MFLGISRSLRRAPKLGEEGLFVLVIDLQAKFSRLPLMGNPSVLFVGRPKLGLDEGWESWIFAKGFA